MNLILIRKDCSVAKQLRPPKNDIKMLIVIKGVILVICTA